MRTVLEIYGSYRIPPWLQEHQLRVAAVGAMMARAAGIEERLIVLTDLFHDMGNILKMDLGPGKPIGHLIPDGELTLWQGVQEEFRTKYGGDEHAASLTIAKEIGLPAEVTQMIDNMRFSRTEWIVREASLEMKIAKYGDLRVAPHGIVPLDERLAEARERYRDKKFDASSEGYSHEKLDATEEMCRELGRIVCERAHIDPASINDESAAPLIEELKKYAVS